VSEAPKCQAPILAGIPASPARGRHRLPGIGAEMGCRNRKNRVDSFRRDDLNSLIIDTIIADFLIRIFVASEAILPATPDSASLRKTAESMRRSTDTFV